MRRFRKTTGFVLLLLFCLLSLVPLFPIASLANLDAVRTSIVLIYQFSLNFESYSWQHRDIFHSCHDGQFPPLPRILWPLVSYLLPLPLSLVISFLDWCGGFRNTWEPTPSLAWTVSSLHDTSPFWSPASWLFLPSLECFSVGIFWRFGHRWIERFICSFRSGDYQCSSDRRCQLEDGFWKPW